MLNPELKYFKRHLPHFQKTDSVYFVTFRSVKNNFSEKEQKIVFDHIVSGGEKYYSLLAFVVMPNHVHLLLHADKGFTLTEIIKGIKGVSARRINQQNNEKGKIWHNESFDRIVRDADELKQKLIYMLNNPVKWNLVENGWNYSGWYFNKKYSFPV